MTLIILSPFMLMPLEWALESCSCQKRRHFSVACPAWCPTGVFFFFKALAVCRTIHITTEFPNVTWLLVTTGNNALPIHNTLLISTINVLLDHDLLVLRCRHVMLGKIPFFVCTYSCENEPLGGGQSPLCLLDSISSLQHLHLACGYMESITSSLSCSYKTAVIVSLAHTLLGSTATSLSCLLPYPSSLSLSREDPLAHCLHCYFLLPLLSPWLKTSLILYHLLGSVIVFFMWHLHITFFNVLWSDFWTALFCSILDEFSWNLNCALFYM